VKVLTVIVNYRVAEMALEAARAALRELEAFPGSRVVIVDNDPGDGSIERITAAAAEAGWGERFEAIASDHNGGFGYGNNLAIRPALGGERAPEYVYLLNPDAFPDPGSIRVLVDFLDSHPEVGIAGSYIHGPDGTPHTTAFRFPTIQSEFESSLGLGLVSRLLRRYVVALPLPSEPAAVDWLAGASMMIRRQVLESAGLFDEAFFLYYEEVDLCLRARRTGWPSYYVPESSVTHIGSVTTGNKDLSIRTPTFLFESRRHYFLKSHGRLYLWAANLAWVLGQSLKVLRGWLRGRPFPDRPRVLRDFLAYNLRPWRVPVGPPGDSPGRGLISSGDPSAR
jgi:N-acetylglucosaminyl-diphospho-decaprenol L-rhamnosyltransferase